MQKSSVVCRRVAFFLAAGFVAWSQRAVPQPLPVPLLWAHSRETFMFQGGQFADTDLLITTDGVSRSTLIRAHNLEGSGWQVTRAVVHASSAQLASLRTAFAEAQIGAQIGGCALPFLVPEMGTYELTWYGRGTRSNSFAMSIGGDGQPCPAALVAVVKLLAQFGGPQLTP
jgi:hypothetical protein